MSLLRKSVIIAMGMVVLVVFGAATLIFLMFDKKDTVREAHLANVEWLPPEASDITYSRREGFGWFKCYECNLPREAFYKLAQKEGWSLAKQKNVSVGLRHLLGLPPIIGTEDGAVDVIESALFFEKRQPNNGGITVVYDLNTERLFVHESHR
jgi:hypothetical protein